MMQEAWAKMFIFFCFCVFQSTFAASRCQCRLWWRTPAAAVSMAPSPLTTTSTPTPSSLSPASSATARGMWRGPGPSSSGWMIAPVLNGVVVIFIKNLWIWFTWNSSLSLFMLVVLMNAKLVVYGALLWMRTHSSVNHQFSTFLVFFSPDFIGIVLKKLIN